MDTEKGWDSETRDENSERTKNKEKKQLKKYSYKYVLNVYVHSNKWAIYSANECNIFQQ